VVIRYGKDGVSDIVNTSHADDDDHGDDDYDDDDGTIQSSFGCIVILHASQHAGHCLEPCAQFLEFSLDSWIPGLY
jgi:hypothetical protein